MDKNAAVAIPATRASALVQNPFDEVHVKDFQRRLWGSYTDLLKTHGVQDGEQAIHVTSLDMMLACVGCGFGFEMVRQLVQVVGFQIVVSIASTSRGQEVASRTKQQVDPCGQLRPKPGLTDVFQLNGRRFHEPGLGPHNLGSGLAGGVQGQLDGVQLQLSDEKLV